MALPLLDGRFSDIRLVNIDSASDSRRGCFSLVFRGIDNSTGMLTAIKFYDPAMANEVYRLESFRREFEILKILRGAEGCLQLVSGLNKYALPIPTVPGAAIPCLYFAVEWIADEIDGYFLNQQSFDAVQKLHLFRDVVAGVNAMHRLNVFHRDLKPDNLRQRTLNKCRSIVPIDMGTAARAEFPNVATAYGISVGAPAYAAPEARFGLAGDRMLARYTDYYALGCMLFELFNSDYFIRAYQLLNNSAKMLFFALQSDLDIHASHEQRRQKWCSGMDKLGGAFVPLPIDEAGSNVPRGIAPILNDLLLSLTHADFRKRPLDLHSVSRKINSCIRILDNEVLYQRRLQQARDDRMRRVARAAEKEARLKLRLAQARRITC